MTWGSQQRPWVLAEVVSTHRRGHRGVLWFRAISSASIHGSFFFFLLFFRFSFCCSPFEGSTSVSVFLLSLCSSVWHTYFFKLKHFPHPALCPSSKVCRGRIKWLSEDITSKWLGQSLNDKTLEIHQKNKTFFFFLIWMLLRNTKTSLITSSQMWFESVFTKTTAIDRCVLNCPIHNSDSGW